MWGHYMVLLMPVTTNSQPVLRTIENVAQVMLYDATYTAWQATPYDPTWHVRLVAICYIVFTVRCYASTILDMALCLSARHKSEFY